MNRLFQLVAVLLVAMALAPAAVAFSACLAAHAHACCRETAAPAANSGAPGCCVVEAADRKSPEVAEAAQRVASPTTELAASNVPVIVVHDRAHAQPVQMSADSSPQQASLCTFLN